MKEKAMGSDKNNEIMEPAPSEGAELAVSPAHCSPLHQPLPVLPPPPQSLSAIRYFENIGHTWYISLKGLYFSHVPNN
jgi:hypothetical protein